MSRYFEILLFEDNPSDALIVEEQLSDAESARNVRLTTVNRLAGGLDLLQRRLFDLALLDLNLPDSSGIQTFKELHRATPDLPIIVLTGQPDHSLAVQILRLGAQDYLLKDGATQTSSILKAIQYAIERNSLKVQLSGRATQLQRSEVRVRAIIESSPDAAIVVDQAGVVQFVNRAAEIMFGRKTSDLLSNDFGFPLVASQVTELDIVRPGGECGVAEMRVAEIEWDNQPAYMASLRDITERKQSEQLIHELNATLERRVAERTAALELANKELDSFCHSVSHDLRAPLRHIRGFSEILAESCIDRLDGDSKTYLGHIIGAADRMEALIADFLNLSRVSRSDLIRSRIDVSALAAPILTRFQELHPHRKVDVQISGGIFVDADPRLLSIVFENLLGNAWKFTSQHSAARIEVGCFREPGGRRVCFVRDNGAGFDMRYAEKLFAPFQRLHSEQDYPGTGVGLTTVQRIIHRHGGRIWAQAGVNQGSTFFFTLEYGEQVGQAAREPVDFEAVAGDPIEDNGGSKSVTTHANS